MNNCNNLSLSISYNLSIRDILDSSIDLLEERITIEGCNHFPADCQSQKKEVEFASTFRDILLR